MTREKHFEIAWNNLCDYTFFELKESPDNLYKLRKCGKKEQKDIMSEFDIYDEYVNGYQIIREFAHLARLPMMEGRTDEELAKYCHIALYIQLLIDKDLKEHGVWRMLSMPDGE
jgi:hypothetical protein